MSNLISGIAPTASAVAQSTQQTTAPAAKAVDTNTPANVTAQRAVQTGAASAAAVVTLSSDKKGRGASYGEGRSVDAAFEKDRPTQESSKKANKKESSVSIKA